MRFPRLFFGGGRELQYDVTLSPQDKPGTVENLGISNWILGCPWYLVNGL